MRIRGGREFVKDGRASEFLGFVLAEYRHDILDWDNEVLVVGFKIDWNRVFGVEQDFVVLSQWDVFVVGDLLANCDDSAGNRRDFRCVRQGDTAFGFSFGFVFEDKHPTPDWFDVLQTRGFFCHNGSELACWRKRGK